MKRRSLRIAILCSFNLDLIQRPLIDALSKRGFEAQLYLSDYGQWEPEAFNSESGLYRFAPDVVFLFVEMADLLPTLFDGNMIPHVQEITNATTAASRRVEQVIAKLLQLLPDHSIVITHTMTPHPRTPLGLLEGNDGFSYEHVAELLNKNLRQRAASQSRLIVFDYRGLVSMYGWHHWHDLRLWHLGRMRLSKQALSLLAEQYARYLSAVYTPRRKCLVLDLDNTLWGGVIGEDGIAGIQIGHQGLGLAYREFQMAALALSQRGIILAISSKNNPEDAINALEKHPDMILRTEHFACMEIGWAPKTEGLRQIAKRLNIGIDSLAFWDDSPLERELVRSQLPQVLVPDVPDDVSNYAAHLLHLDCFDVLSLTDEDRRRNLMYRQQSQRAQYLEEEQPGDLTDFYHSLEVVATIDYANEITLNRVAQLTQRTNQFNFTSRRYNQADIQEMLNNPSYRIYTLSLRDRFGDLGLVSVAIVHTVPEAWTLDTFLMSCRALGRGVEDTFLAFIALVAHADEAQLHGTFIPTAKNVPVREFLDRLQISLEGDETEHQFSLQPDEISTPSWITINHQTENESHL